jgi:hypothetical protein
MAFDRPARTGGDYLDLRTETETGPRLVAFRVLDFLPAEDGDFVDRATGAPAKVYPVLADAMVIDGPNAGTVYRAGTFKYAITNALRGVGGTDPTPATVPGQQIAVRAERSKKKGVSTQTVWGNDPSDAELELIEKEFVRFGGWDARPATNGAVPTREPAMAGAGAPATAEPEAPRQTAGSGARRPFGNR